MRAVALARRRARIERVALELFRDRGFDRVTVADVCAAADVSPATFYRRFGTKEAVVFAYREEFATALHAAVDAAAQLPESDRLSGVLERFVQFLESQRNALAVRDAIVLGHPRLMQQTLAIQRDMEGVLATGLARLRGLEAADPAAMIEAGVGMLVLRIAVRTWRGSGGSLLCVTRETLDDVRRVVGRPEVDEGRQLGGRRR
jgi:AcrR family transcriptional regulator